MTTLEQVTELFNRPLFDLIFEAEVIHRQNFAPGKIQASSLLSIKTGGCPENCSYCPQSAHYDTGVEKTRLMDVDAITTAAKQVKAAGATRFCMGAAWREVKDGPQFDQVIQAVEAVSQIGLQVCCTLGMLNQKQAERLKAAGLYAYNHNLDTSRRFYSSVIQTRTYEDRLDTIKNVRSAGLNVCTGGILGLGETEQDRIEFIHELVTIKPQPESLTINTLVAFDGTPLEKRLPVSGLDVARVTACLRILAPQSMIRLSAGRLSMSDESQFLCYLAGANSIFLGDKLLTSPNPSADVDISLLKRLGFELSQLGEHV